MPPSSPRTKSAGSGLGRGLRRIARGTLVLAAVLYPATLIVIALLLRYVGERWWMTGLGLFAPRLPFVLPLPFLVLGLALTGLQRWLWTQLLAVLVWFFPLMGGVLPLPVWGPGERPVLRILSCNMNAGYGDPTGVARFVEQQRPDLVLFVELLRKPDEFQAALASQFPHIQHHFEFLIASRFPIVETRHPKDLLIQDRAASPRYIKYTLDTPLGVLSVFNAHPVSPRSALYRFMAKGLPSKVLRGEIPTQEGIDKLRGYNLLREAQLRALAANASAQQAPVIIAGDFNTPQLSPYWARYFSDYHDGFVEAGWGFGYTYPKRPIVPPWMRLDRILASDRLRFVDFDVLPDSDSDHYCVVAAVVSDE